MKATKELDLNLAALRAAAYQKLRAACKELEDIDTLERVLNGHVAGVPAPAVAGHLDQPVREVKRGRPVGSRALRSATVGANELVKAALEVIQRKPNGIAGADLVKRLKGLGVVPSTADEGWLRTRLRQALQLDKSVRKERGGGRNGAALIYYPTSASENAPESADASTLGGSKTKPATEHLMRWLVSALAQSGQPMKWRDIMVAATQDALGEKVGLPPGKLGLVLGQAARVLVKQKFVRRIKERGQPVFYRLVRPSVQVTKQ